MDLAIQDTVSFHVSLVVLPIDDFTGRPITGGQVRIFIPGQRPPVVKSDGYHVFANLQKPRVKVCCESALYTPRTEEIILSAEKNPLVVKLRLSPNASYAVPPGATCVVGKAPPGRRIRFCSTDSADVYRLSGEYIHTGDASDTLSIFNPKHRELEGKTMLIRDKNGQQEYLTVAGLKEDTYRLAEPLQHDYKKADAVLHPVYETYSNSMGDFFLLLGSSKGEEVLWSWEIEGDKKLREIVLTPGRTSRLQWKEEV